jgi:hypothetical protein
VGDLFLYINNKPIMKLRMMNEIVNRTLKLEFGVRGHVSMSWEHTPVPSQQNSQSAGAAQAVPFARKPCA